MKIRASVFRHSPQQQNVCPRQLASDTPTGVVATLRGVGQVGLHGGQVVELSVLLGVHQERGLEEDGEGQVEVEREEGEVRENRTCVKMQEHLSHEVHVTSRL